MSTIIYQIDDLYTRIERWAASHHAVQTLAALPYARDHHEGQFRKGQGHIPYIYHPLMVAAHAIAMGREEDDLIAALLLHDVCEDCRNEQGGLIRPEDLPVGKAAQEAVRLVTKPDEAARYDGWEEDYYANIPQNHLALIVKLLDRCNNVSLMAGGFTHDKMEEYIAETERYILPYLDVLDHADDDRDRRTAFLIRYQLVSDLENSKRLL